MSSDDRILNRFVSHLRKSGLVEEAELDKVLIRCGTTQRSPGEELDFLASALLEARLLTDWKVKKLLNGKHRGFIVDEFVLLEHLESAASFDRYLARERKRDREVVLKFSRPV